MNYKSIFLILIIILSVCLLVSRDLYRYKKGYCTKREQVEATSSTIVSGAIALMAYFIIYHT